MFHFACMLIQNNSQEMGGLNYFPGMKIMIKFYTRQLEQKRIYVV